MQDQEERAGEKGGRRRKEGRRKREEKEREEEREEGEGKGDTSTVNRRARDHEMKRTWIGNVGCQTRFNA